MRARREPKNKVKKKGIPKKPQHVFIHVFAQTTHDVAAPHGFACVVIPATRLYIPSFIEIRSEVSDPRGVKIWPFPLLWLVAFTTACTTVQAVTSRDLSTACTIATFIVHSKLDYCNSRYTISSLRLNYPVFSRFRTLLLVLWLKLLSPVISLSSYALSTGPGSLNASNTSSSHLPTKFSQLHNLHTFITLSLFNVLTVLALYRRYSCLSTDIILSKSN